MEDATKHRSCPQCQSPVLETQRFCRYCGHRLDAGLQDYVETQPYERSTRPDIRSVEPVSLYPSWSPTVAAETTPLVVRRRPKVLHGFLILFLLGTLGAGIALFRQQNKPVAPVEEEVPASVLSAESIPLPPPLPAPPPAAIPTPAPPPPPSPPPDHVSGHQIHQQISRLLARQAALTQRKIDLLLRRLKTDGALSDMQREALLARIKELQEERLGVLAAAQALKSEALQGLLQDVVPAEEILKAVEAELKRHNVHVDLSNIDVR